MNPNCKNWYKDIKLLRHLLGEYKAEYAIAVETADFEKCKVYMGQLKQLIKNLQNETDLKRLFLHRIRNVADENLRFELAMLVSQRYFDDAKKVAKRLAPSASIPSHRQIIRMLYRLTDQELLALGRLKQPRLLIVPPGNLKSFIESAEVSDDYNLDDSAIPIDYKPSLPSDRTTVCIMETEPNPDETPGQIPILQKNAQQYDICREHLSDSGFRLPKDTEYMAGALLSIDQFINAYKQIPGQIRMENMILDYMNAKTPTMTFLENNTEEDTIPCADIKGVVDITSIANTAYQLRFLTESKTDNAAYLRARAVFELK